MTEFLQTLLTFPTIFFTVLLILVLFYWMMVIFGAIDLDALGGADAAAEGLAEGIAEGAAEGIAEGAAEGIAEGAAEGLAEGIAEGAAEGLAEGAAEGIADAAAEGLAEGLAEGAAEGIADAAAEGIADAAVEGLADAAAEGAADAAAEGVADAAADAAGEGAEEASGGALAGLLAAMSLRGVPVTLTLSVVILISWMASFVSSSLLGFTAADASALLVYGGGSGIAFGSLILGVVVTSFALRPLKGTFATTRKIGQQTLIGQTCEVLTGRVTETFGRAEFDDGAGDLLIEVRCDTPNNGLKAGARALIIDYDPKEHVYHVEPVDQFLSLKPKPTLSLEEQIQQAAEEAAQVKARS
ncbi:MAG: hypothetical protein CMH57_04970 [Myxococcales bacterium]|nr:hypothetical protein [Myxococcales bacterium]